MTMSEKQCLALVSYYQQHLDKLYPNISPERGGRGIAHIKAMFPLMRNHLEEGQREKFMRWLGFVQGWLWSNQIFDISEMADHNRS